jgi:hypothetical protein
VDVLVFRERLSLWADDYHSSVLLPFTNAIHGLITISVIPWFSTWLLAITLGKSPFQIIRELIEEKVGRVSVGRPVRSAKNGCINIRPHGYLRNNFQAALCKHNKLTENLRWSINGVNVLTRG